MQAELEKKEVILAVMSEKEKNLIEETVENLKQMDEASLRIMKSNSDILKARDALDKKTSNKKAR